MHSELCPSVRGYFTVTNIFPVTNVNKGLFCLFFWGGGVVVEYFLVLLKYREIHCKSSVKYDKNAL